MEVNRIGSSFAARVTGLDIATGTGEGDIASVEQALAAFPVLCFADQTLDDAQQSRFVHSLGPAFEVPYCEVARAEGNDARLVDVANVEQDGSPIAAESSKRKFYDANLLWHTDGSYSPRPIRISSLSARALPSAPPDTEFADMRAAWDDLPDAMKRRCEGLVVEHSLLFSRRKMGMEATEFSDATLRMFGVPARHPLVRTHPRSGRKSLYLSSHAGGIVGWEPAAAVDFLTELIEFATGPAYVYAHKWHEADMLMWDDSCTMHRATPYDGAEPRMLRWASVLELEPTIAA